MADIETKPVSLSLTAETVRMLKAFTAARNGSIHNQADSVIRSGINVKLAEAPEVFRERYLRALSSEQGND